MNLHLKKEENEYSLSTILELLMMSAMVKWSINVDGTKEIIEYGSLNAYFLDLMGYGPLILRRNYLGFPWHPILAVKFCAYRGAGIKFMKVTFLFNEYYFFPWINHFLWKLITFNTFNF